MIPLERDRRREWCRGSLGVHGGRTNKCSSPLCSVRQCKWLSRVRPLATPRTTQSMEFSRPEYWNGEPSPSPGDLPSPGIEPRSPALQVDSLPAEPPGKPKNTGVGSLALLQQISPTQEMNRGLPHGRRILLSKGSLFWGPALRQNYTCATVYAVSTFSAVVTSVCVLSPRNTHWRALAASPVLPGWPPGRRAQQLLLRDWRSHCTDRHLYNVVPRA